MAGINKVILIGNVGRDPEIRTLESGTKVATFSLATSESYKDNNNEWKEQTEWHNIVLWRNLAERAESSLKKGMQVYLEGKLRTRQWTDQNQQTRYTTEVVGDKIQILTRRDDKNSNVAPPPTEQHLPNQTAANHSADPVISPSSGDDLPF